MRILLGTYCFCFIDTSKKKHTNKRKKSNLLKEKRGCEEEIMVVPDFPNSQKESKRIKMAKEKKERKKRKMANWLSSRISKEKNE